MSDSVRDYRAWLQVVYRGGKWWSLGGMIRDIYAGERWFIGSVYSIGWCRRVEE